MEPDQLAVLRDKVPYLIAMAVEDLNEFEIGSYEDTPYEPFSIPAPSGQPTIGVIDTLFDDSVYFNEWVTSVDCLDPQLERCPEDYVHGTGVCSIIVDGPSLNPRYEDGCGRFKVKHFGVAGASGFSSYSVLRAIREAVRRNPDIKVWNLSLGSKLPVPDNYISSEAAELDKIQAEYDVVFVIAGTNGSEPGLRLGAPADSINGIVVNSCRSDGTPASYSRRGPVLSFYGKPDLSAPGGDYECMERLQVSISRGITKTVYGTSYAAPWISRKLAYLICVAGLTRECAKALLVDSAIGWGNNVDTSVQGYGVVPQHINAILKSPDGEIRFLMNGVSEEYDTYTYDLPVPIVQGKHPFFSKAVLCYFPHCSRNQGVDYTNTEMTLKFGRLKPSGEFMPINRSMQDVPGCINYEEDERGKYRKWDNVKTMVEKIPTRSVPRDVFRNGLWGISVKTKERLKEKSGLGLRFGLVLTLKEMLDVNRIDDFIYLCSLKGWIVTPIDIDNRIDVYNTAQQEIVFD